MKKQKTIPHTLRLKKSSIATLTALGGIQNGTRNTGRTNILICPQQPTTLTDRPTQCNDTQCA